MKRNILLIGLVLIILNSCSSDSDTPLPDGPVEIPIIGVYAKENQWIYEQMNHYYLWREDLPDSLSCNYTTDPVTFYKALLSPKDRFSYCSRNVNYTGSAESTFYGFTYQKYKSATDGDLLQVLYVTSGKLKRQGLHRGDWLRELSLEKYKTSYERGNVKRGIFHVCDTLSIEAASWEENRNTVYMDSIYSVNDAKVGYLCYLEFDNVKDLEKPLRKFYKSHIDELILDLRYNPGGYVRTCRYLCNSIVHEQGYNKIFQQCTYNDSFSQEYLKENGRSITKEYYGVPTNGNGQVMGSEIYGLSLKRLYVLTSQNTASASEATIVCLRPFMDVIVIGEQTYGKGVGSWTISEKQYKYMLHPIIMRYYNASMETTPDDGIPANWEVEGGYETIKQELGDTNEPLLATALSCIKNETLHPSIITLQTRSTGLALVGKPSFFNKIIVEY